MNQRTNKIIYIVGFIYFGFSTITTASHKPKDVYIFVFVHGIMNIADHLSLDLVPRIWQDKLECTPYAWTLEHMRQDSFFYQNQPIQGPGLVQANPEKYGGNAIYALGQVIEQANLPKKYENPQFYTFGWNGLLSHSNRYKAARNLLESLIELRHYHASQGTNAHFHLVGYSHGGNVILNIAQAIDDTGQNLAIDEIILLGTPIHPGNTELALHDCFLKVYNLFSTGDWVQTVDGLSGTTSSSKRMFICKKDFKLPEKIVQVKLKVTRLTKSRRCKPPLTLLPAVINGRTPYLRDNSPGHIEFWFFGWSPAFYRCNFPFFPIPFVGWIPFLLNIIDKYPINLCNPEDYMIIDIRPEYDVILIRDSQHKFHGLEQFISAQKREEIIKSIEWAQPAQKMDQASYNARVYNICCTVRKGSRTHHSSQCCIPSFFDNTYTRKRYWRTSSCPKSN
ncbi:hypothetical protein KG892_02140 [Vermiphilus pyriformis]|nr:MAG: hypothetical protein KG892_02140 [Vermiphilus pyriformis]